MTIHFAKRGQAPIGGCEPTADDRTFARWGAVDVKGTQVDCTECLAFRPVVENDKFVAMMQRNIRKLEERAIADPSVLASVLLLVQQLSEVVNVAIAANMNRYETQGAHAAPSGKEMAAVLGMKPQSITDRRKLGNRTIFERSMGQETITQAERAARTRAAAHADATLAAWLERASKAQA